MCCFWRDVSQFSKYQQQPQLLDQHLHTLVHLLMQPVVRAAHANVRQQVEYYYYFAFAVVRSVKTLHFINTFKSISTTVANDVIASLRLVYVLCRVRGFKFVGKLAISMTNVFFLKQNLRAARFLPHAALDLEAALLFVEQLPNNTPWECHYVALLWLAVLVLVCKNIQLLSCNKKNNLRCSVAAKVAV